MLGRAFRNHRSGLVLIAGLAVVVLVALVFAGVVAQRDHRASANQPQSRESPASFGIDPEKGSCPKSEPEELPPNALAGATNAVLAHFEDVEEAEGQYAVSADRGLDGEFLQYNCPELSSEREFVPAHRVRCKV